MTSKISPIDDEQLAVGGYQLFFFGDVTPRMLHMLQQNARTPMCVQTAVTGLSWSQKGRHEVGRLGGRLVGNIWKEQGIWKYIRLKYIAFVYEILKCFNCKNEIRKKAFLK